MRKYVSKDEATPATDGKIVVDGLEKNLNETIGKSSQTTKKPLEFRKRLWHKPYQLDHSFLDDHALLQKDLKVIGGEELQWGMAYVHHFTERDLLRYYHRTVQRESLSASEKAFYEALRKELGKRTGEVDVVFEKTQKCFARTPGDVLDAAQLMKSLIRKRRKYGYFGAATSI